MTLGTLLSRAAANPTGKTAFSLYLTIVGISCLVVLNLLVISTVDDLGPANIAYIGLMDVAALAVCYLFFRHARTATKSHWTAAFAGLALLPVVALVVELALTYVKLTYPDAFGNGTLPGYLQPDSRLGWAPIPNTTVNGGGAVYQIDQRGRRATPQFPTADRTIHFFGDWFTFGYGVNNADSALSVLADTLRGRANVLNYGIKGYGLEQMYLRFVDFIEDVRPGDIVVFSPISQDVQRNYIHKVRFCDGLFREALHVAYRGIRLPKYSDGKWQFVPRDQECGPLESLLLNSHHMPFGFVYRRYVDATTYGRLIRNADEIVAQAQRLAARHGAQFHLLFLVKPDECLAGRYDFDITGLRSPYHSLMPYCPTDETAIRQLRLARDEHWNVAGNRWAAQRISDILSKIEAR